MFHDNGDGTWTVRFYNADGARITLWLTGNFPRTQTAISSMQITACTTRARPEPLWMAFAEKAYVEFCVPAVRTTRSAAVRSMAISFGGTALILPACKPPTIRC